MYVITHDFAEFPVKHINCYKSVFKTELHKNKKYVTKKEGAQIKEKNPRTKRWS
jgi:hypothetical protein